MDIRDLALQRRVIQVWYLTKGNISDAARRLGVSRTVLQKQLGYLKRLGFQFLIHDARFVSVYKNGLPLDLGGVNGTRMDARVAKRSASKGTKEAARE